MVNWNLRELGFLGIKLLSAVSYKMYAKLKFAKGNTSPLQTAFTSILHFEQYAAIIQITEM